MGDDDRHQAPPHDLPCSTNKVKRKHTADHRNRNRHRHHHRHNHNNKRLKLTPESQTPRNSCNTFYPLHSQRARKPLSYSKKKLNCHQNTTNSSTSDTSRSWSCSSHDSSVYKDKVVVMSYNILGVENALKHPYLYWKVPQEFLEWDYRKKLICNEIKSYNAGILCLQEVDRFKDLDRILRKDGFKGVYKARTGDADDGCAIFWKDELFTLLHEENIEFQSFGLRNNIAQFCVFKMINDETDSDLCTHASNASSTQSRSLVVGNIHVLFNPSRGDIKLGQVRLFLEKAYKLSQEWGSIPFLVRLFLEKAYKLSQEWGSIPVILGGDLNTIPQSAMYQFLASSELDILLHDRKNISGQLDLEHRAHPKDSRFWIAESTRCHVSRPISRPLMSSWNDEEVNIATGSQRVTHLQHHLKLRSAYCGIRGSSRVRDKDGEPLATSYHSKFMGTVDYIWHTEELIPLRVLETLPVNVLRRSIGLPNERWGSDHLAIVCELAFTDIGIKN